jgi:glycosyltransferase involved in cell wall biosynthesis
MSTGDRLAGASRSPLQIALIAPPFLPVPPPAYAGTERVIAALAAGLHLRGHHVTVYASGDSDLPCEVVPVVPRALWRAGYRGEAPAYVEMAVAQAWADSSQYDVIHSHVETAAFLMARYCETPVVTTLHRRLDVGGVAEMIDRFGDVPLVAISESQRRWSPGANWIATIHHGLDFSATPAGNAVGDYLLFVGRISPEKGVAEAIQVARRTGRRLVMAAKVYEAGERALFDDVVRPAIDAGVVDWRGEVGTHERDRLMAGAFATLMLGGWPEPFGLVAIESMATGTPVIARRAGGCTETIEHGVTGFLVDDVDEAVHAVSRIDGLHRPHIAAYARGRFSADRMVARYEQAFELLLAERTPSAAPRPMHEMADATRAVQGRRGVSRPTAVAPGPARSEPAGTLERSASGGTRSVVAARRSTLTSPRTHATQADSA